MKIIIHTDGGARGNPGPAAVGVVIEMPNDKCQMTNDNSKFKKKTLIKFGKRIGEATNNVAEYTAVIEAFKNVKLQMSNVYPELRRDKCDEQAEIQFYLDSTLVVNQLNGKFKVKDANLRSLITQIRILEAEIGGNISYSYIPREENREADFFVNQALDNSI